VLAPLLRLIFSLLPVAGVPDSGQAFEPAKGAVKEGRAKKQSGSCSAFFKRNALASVLSAAAAPPASQCDPSARC
jgi:hypothetical protein